jgi:hypothetical protein
MNEPSNRSAGFACWRQTALPAGRAESIAVTNNQLDIFPVKEKQNTKWAPARLFINREEAERWKASVPYGAAIQLINFAGEAAKQ